MEDLVRKITVYQPQADVDLLWRAYNFARKIHQKASRLNSKPHLQHLLGTARLLADIKAGSSMVAAGLLHDVIDAGLSDKQKISKGIHPEVADLVAKVSSLKSIPTKVGGIQYRENIGRFILALAKDVRPVLIRLAEKIDNLRSLDSLPSEKRQIVLSKTFVIYAPLADWLGVHLYKRRLEDGAFRYAHPDQYFRIRRIVGQISEQLRDWRKQFPVTLGQLLNQASINAEIEGRVKHLYSTYKKFLSKNESCEKIEELVSRYWDIVAFRVITDTEADCYKVLSVLDENWERGPKFTDYIVHPRPNGYQSINTSIIGTSNVPVEVQIRTHQMHEYNEYGPAAHIYYKEVGYEKGGRLAAPDKKVAWLRDLLKWQKSLLAQGQPENFEIDVFTDRVFVITPTGDIFDLPQGATPVDFAYSVHSDIGDTCRGALVNGKMVPLNYKLKTGEVCEILVDRNRKKPSLDWLNFVKTETARRKIRYAQINE